MRFAALGAALLWANLAAAETLTADQMRAFGSEAVLRGFADQALGVADALLLRDPGDSGAMTLRAQALRVKGDLAGSAAAARRAWDLADDRAERYAAATALAQALSLQNRRTVAQYWLRQATQNAPNAAARAQALQDFAYVRGQNPLRMQVQASVRPSNNVNGGTREDSFYVPIFGGIDLPYLPSDRALSGQVWALGLSGTYKLHETARVQDALTFTLRGQGAVLSDRSRAAAPSLRNGDFTFGQVEAGFQRKLALPGSLITLDLIGGHSWYGGRDLADSLRAEATLETGAASLTASLDRQVRLDRPQSSSTTFGVAGEWATGGWTLGLDLSRAVSQDRGAAHAAATLSLEWQAGQPVMGVNLGANVAARFAEYDSGRVDRRVAMGLSGAVPGLSYLGFQPVLSLDAARNTSTNSRFSTDTVGVGLSLTSSF